MPIYEYLCESCGDKFEKLVRRAEDVLEAGCPSCGEKQLEQQYSTFAAPGGESAESCFTPAATRGEGSCPCGSSPGMCGQN